MADSNSTNAAQEGDEVIMLDADDHMHLFNLIDLAERSLPNDTDADDSRACLRAAREFLLTTRRTVSQEARHG